LQGNLWVEEEAEDVEEVEVVVQGVAEDIFRSL
jgi:hypothetical protein